MILAIDTTHEFGSVALAREDGTPIAESPIHAPDGFGHILFDRIRRLLDTQDARIDAITKVAAAAGPGSFTGVRVGLTAAKGLAEAVGVPVVAVSNLAAIASFGVCPLRAAFCDARRGQIYGAVYNAALDPVEPEVVAPMDSWIESVPAGAEFVATDLVPFDAVLAGRRRTQAPRSLAAAIARIAAGRPGEDPAAVDANYVRRSDAELLWKDR